MTLSKTELETNQKAALVPTSWIHNIKLYYKFKFKKENKEV
jgi:hypothetical protein